MFTKKSSFSAGELDPALRDKTDVQSYYSGLAKAQNVIISKTGRIINSAGTWFNETARATIPENVRIFVPEVQTKEDTNPGRSYILELGFDHVAVEGYVRAYLIDFYKDDFIFDPTVFLEVTIDSLDWEATDIPNLSIREVKLDEDDKFAIYIARPGKKLKRVEVTTSPVPAITISNVYPEHPVIRPITSVGPTVTPVIEYTGNNATMMARVGHQVEYGITVVLKDGQESPIVPITKYSDNTGTPVTAFIRLPTGTEFSGLIFKNIRLATTNLWTGYGDKVDYLRIYRKPYKAGSWGLVGESDNDIGANFNIAQSVGFTDFGQIADYTNPPPEFFEQWNQFVIDDIAIDPQTGKFFQYLTADRLDVYSKRLVLIKKDTALFSKINEPGYFLKDFPGTEATAFIEEIGINSPTIYHTLDYSGLMIAASEGVFYGGADAPVSSVNPFIRRVGKDVIDSKVAPIVTPYGLLVVDNTTNSVRALSYDDRAKTTVSEDVSLFSSHIFYGKSVKSWAFQGGDNAQLFVVLDDGTAASLTYNPTDKLNAWTVHNTDGKYLQVESFRDPITGHFYLMFLVQRGEKIFLESSSSRVKYDPETLRAFSHSSIKYFVPIANPGPDFLTLTLKSYPVIPQTWDTMVYCDTAVSPLWTGTVGQTFGVFDPLTDSYIYLKVTNVVASTLVEFSVEDQPVPINLQNVAAKVYRTHTTVQGLDHLEGREVSVVCDNAVKASPLNDVENLALQTVVGGEIELENTAVVTIVGLPYISDVETLEIDNQAGTLSRESKIVNEVTVRYIKSRGVYVSGEFPEETYVEGMEDSADWNRFSGVNQTLKDTTASKTYRPKSSWNTNGKMCFRQVDPLPFEIASIMLDVSGG